MGVDISQWSHLADFVGHSIGVLSCFFLLLRLCLLAIYGRKDNYFIECGHNTSMQIDVFSI